MEPISSNSSEVVKESQKIDRVVLDKESLEIIESMLKQIQSFTGDLIQVSQKDVVNFLIQKRSNLLDESELSQIKKVHFDIVRALKLATQAAIKSKQNGIELNIDDVLKIIQTPSVDLKDSKNRTYSRGRKKKKDSAKEDDVDSPTTATNLELIPLNSERISNKKDIFHKEKTDSLNRDLS